MYARERGGRPQGTPLQDEQTDAFWGAYGGEPAGFRGEAIRRTGGYGEAGERSPNHREIVIAPDSVCVVPVDEDGNVYLVRQYRKPPERLLLEVVAGGVDEGESAEEAARRELREEAGLRAEKLELLSFFWMSPGFCTEGMHAYLATGLSFGESAPEDDENIEVVRVRLEEVPGLIASGELQDCKSIAALMLRWGGV